MYDCLVAWVNTFNLGMKCDHPNDFKDGLILAKCLNNIDPDYFSEEWLGKIKTDTNQNWRLKLLNLKKILQTLTDYYSEVLNHSLGVNDLPNLNLIVDELNSEATTTTTTVTTTTNNKNNSITSSETVSSKESSDLIPPQSSSSTDPVVYEELTHLLQLILGCAVNCQRKSEFINKIMEMAETTQHMIMTAIQELMSKDNHHNHHNSNSYNGQAKYFSSSSFLLAPMMTGANNNNNNTITTTNTSDESEENNSFGEQLRKALSEMNRLVEQKEDTEQKCKRLDRQVSELQDEKMALTSEIEMLKTKLQRDDSARLDPSNELNKQVRLQQKLEMTQEELFRVESDKEKYRIQLEAAKLEQDLLIEKNVELKKLSQEHQTLRDEIDVMKHRSDRVEMLESSIEQYKIKLEDMADLRKQLKCMEEANTSYLEKILAMEEEVKRISTLKTQIDMYKRQIQELHEQVLADEMRMKKLEYEHRMVEESAQVVRNERDRLLSELERVKDWNEQLTMNEQVRKNSSQTFQQENTLVSSTSESSNQSMEGLFSSVELVNIPGETKEKILRLYHENKFLKAKQNELIDERLLMLNSQYDDERTRNAELQLKLNETSKQKIELECQLNDQLKKSSSQSIKTAEIMQSNTSKTRDELVEELKAKLQRTQTQMEEHAKNGDALMKKMEKRVEVLMDEKNEMKEVKEKELAAKEKEIVELNEKYRIYLEKAKIVIKSLDPRNTPNAGAHTNTEMQFLKSQLSEKEKLVKQLTKDNEKLRNSREQEEQLIASAWYQLGANLNRRVTDDRLLSIGNSFLSQQRHLPNPTQPLSTSTATNQSTTFNSSANDPKQQTTRKNNLTNLTNKLNASQAN